MFLLFSNSDGLGDPKSLYPSEFILSIPPPACQQAYRPNSAVLFGNCPQTQKSPGAGRTPSVKPCGFATSLSEGGNPLRHRCAMPPPPKGGGVLHLTGRRKAPFLRDDFPRPGENVAQRQKGESGTPQATGGVCPQTQKSPAERVLCGAGMQVLRRYAYSLTTKRTRVYSFCLVTVTPNLVGFITPACSKLL